MASHHKTQGPRLVTFGACAIYILCGSAAMGDPPADPFAPYTASEQGLLRLPPPTLPAIGALEGAEHEPMTAKELFDAMNVDQFVLAMGPACALGQNVRLAIFDVGFIFPHHNEFQSQRIVLPPTAAVFNEHATNVAGPIAATGLQLQARGIASRIRVRSFVALQDDLDHLEQLANQIDLSNHSYGERAGFHRESVGSSWYWYGNPDQIEDARFGKYGERQRKLDAILFGSPHLLTFAAAGNDRDDVLTGPSDDANFAPETGYFILQKGAAGEVAPVSSVEPRRRDGFDQGGLDTIVGLGLAKNAICIGGVDAMQGTDGYLFETSQYSAWGPSDDGRIKPDLVAVSLFRNADGVPRGIVVPSFKASLPMRTDQYAEFWGTSSASPVGAAIGALGLESYCALRGAGTTPAMRPLSSEIKAVLIHTAMDLGTLGPDPKFGWGLIDAQAAADVIDPAKAHIIEVRQVARDVPVTIPLRRANGDTGGLRATVVWIDPPGAASKPNQLDESTITLTNDLDAQLIGPDGKVFHPYSLDQGSPLSPATANAANRRDNVEVIDAPPAAGDWTLKVVAAHLTSGDQQQCAIVISGLSRRQE